MKTAVSDGKNLLTPKQAAEQLSVDVRTVRRWRARGLLKAVTIGTRYVRFRQSEVDRLISRSTD